MTRYIIKKTLTAIVLDVTTQAQVMDLLADMVKKYNKSLVVITHNLGLVTRYAQRVYVMYAGKIVVSRR